MIDMYIIKRNEKRVILKCMKIKNEETI